MILTKPLADRLGVSISEASSSSQTRPNGLQRVVSAENDIVDNGLSRVASYASVPSMYSA